MNFDKLYIENNGVISINPSEFHRKTENGDIKFQVINGLGYSNASVQLGSAKYDSGKRSFVAYDFMLPKQEMQQSTPICYRYLQKTNYIVQVMPFKLMIQK